MDAIAGIYSVSVTLDQVQQARIQLTVYLQRFRSKLKGKNRTYIAQTLRVLNSIITFLHAKNVDSKPTDGVADLGALMSGKGVDQINVLKLNRYLQESRLARKVDGYTAYYAQSDATKNSFKLAAKSVTKQTMPVLTHVQSFILSLMNPSTEGRFFFSKDESTSITLKYMLLDPTFHFRSIVEDARAVVLAGGTMSPVCRPHTQVCVY
jgi:chromosome transmission fidelity protein 1